LPCKLGIDQLHWFQVHTKTVGTKPRIEAVQSVAHIAHHAVRPKRIFGRGHDDAAEDLDKIGEGQYGKQ